ncbi:MAG TPA: ATP-binding cassette domain-containing protein [Phycisphaerae bacterium]|mgnify:CR=1 FL=1|nr:ATP-binding cassette domain-containing protein [Phycisphaerae bacterium]HOJ72916.1 ATP-binding cassette domain-containing protein [Phycisphaerae bacterium]HOM50100.1 ATP-binding cassette domain-containing protein [Phycisphaerae bacterium]HON65372.1 ATP-binding cassette domain-containing protein [Phycisphaerae bacterium]HOQ86972.1 ATP-binding cassette domain-containing protein [Phycisphaerae bacterium]
MIEVHDLVKVFPTATGYDKQAVAGVSFTVGQGEIYGLLGPNGAGKTTTLRILSGLMKPTSGRAIINGYDVTANGHRAKGSIGFLTANTGLYQRLSPRELLPYFGELHGLDRDTIKRRVRELIEWLDIGPFADIRCGALSTGQKQRTNIARALIADPPVLIMDEPTLGLDVLSNRIILDFIRRERDHGKAVLLSTHYLDEAEALCDRIGLLHQGRIIAEGDMPTLRAMAGRERLTDIFLSLVSDSLSPTFVGPRPTTPVEPVEPFRPADCGQPASDEGPRA